MASKAREIKIYKMAGWSENMEFAVSLGYDENAADKEIDVAYEEGDSRGNETLDAIESDVLRFIESKGYIVIEGED